MISSLQEKNQGDNSSTLLYRIGECRDCEALNAVLRARLALLTESDIVRRSHLVDGRHENIYVLLASIPELRVILDLATAQAAHILKRPKKDLALGWWLNIMRPGERTGAHTHDESDELLSGTYYIDAPPGCGKLLLTQGALRNEVEPREGMFVFFRPVVMHEVTRNLSGRSRISVGFNLGPAPH